jgi:hypothetical protein
MAKIVLINYNLCGKIFGNLSFVELNRNELTQLGRDNTRMRIVFVQQRFLMSELNPGKIDYMELVSRWVFSMHAWGGAESGN